MALKSSAEFQAQFDTDGDGAVAPEELAVMTYLMKIKASRPEPVVDNMN